MDNPLQRDVFLKVVLPGGLESDATVHGSKPVMDFLVTLCAGHHLNPADHSVEILAPNSNRLSFKANAPIGLLDAEKIILKPKGGEEKRRQPYKPEATVRLLISYNTSHKTVLRVNPRLPLGALLPLVCEKCEFNPESTVLLRDAHATESLDVSRTLDELGLREVFAVDQRAQTSRRGVALTDVHTARVEQKKTQSQKGFLKLFWRKKQKHKNKVVSAPSSPGHLRRVAGEAERMRSTNTLPGDFHKKRKAPQPPVGGILSRRYVEDVQRFEKSSSRSIKRKAPLPPPLAPTSSVQDLEEDVNARDCPVETESSSPSLRHLSHPSTPSPIHFQQTPDPRPPSSRRKDFSDARSALAKVLTSSVSKGALAKRLRNSAAFPKFHVSSCVSMTTDCLENHAGVATRSHWKDPDEKLAANSCCDPDLIADVPEQYQITEMEEVPFPPPPVFLDESPSHPDPQTTSGEA